MVLMAFRTGRHVASLAERLCPSVQRSQSWTYILPGVKQDQARLILDEFHHANVSN